MTVDVITLLVSFVLLCFLVMALEGRVRRVEEQMKSHRQKHNLVDRERDRR